MHAVYLGDADTAHMAVYKHLAGAALANAAFHGALALFEAHVVHRETGLMQGCGYCLAFLAADGVSFVGEFVKIFPGNVQDGVRGYFVHCLMW